MSVDDNKVIVRQVIEEVMNHGNLDMVDQTYSAHIREHSLMAQPAEAQ